MIIPLIAALRPKQWSKNFFLFAGILFSQNITNTLLLTKTVYSFVIFCFLSGSIYILNDLFDIETDKYHPVKAGRPIASGRLKQSHAIIFLIFTIPVLFVLSYLLSLPFFLTTVGYFFLQVAYSLLLKHLVIIDLFSIALGFVLRVVAGAVVIDVSISSWLLICTTLLSLFLGLSKRRHELEICKGEVEKQRLVLKEYSTYMLEQMISVVTASTVIAYALYTMSTETVEKFGTTKLVYTVPFVLYGIFRYLYLIFQKGEGENPENMLVNDIPLLCNIFLWILTVGIILYVL